MEKHYTAQIVYTAPNNLKMANRVLRIIFPALLAILLFGAGHLSAQSNVVVDKISGPVSPNSGTTITVSHQTGNAADRIMLVGISVRDRTVSNVTYGGTTLTLLTSQTSSKESRTYIYYMLNPPSGTANVVVTINTGATNDRRAVVGVATFSNVDVTNFVANANAATAVGNNTAPTVNVTSATGNLVFDVVAARAQNIITIGSGQTQRWLLNGQTPRGAATTEPGAGTVTMSHTLAGSTNWSMSAVNIKYRYGAADLQVTKSVNNSSPVLGSNVTFTITASNPAGPSNAGGVTVNDLLPNGFTISGIPSASQGSYNTSTGVWSIGSLNIGVSATLTIVATVNCASNYLNIATISGNDPDPNSSNNAATVLVNPQSTTATTHYLCPGQTFDLTPYSPCNKPTGTNVTWHTSAEATSANKVSNPAAVTGSPSPGTKYYVAFEDPTNNCYSPTTEFTIITYPQITATLAAAQNPLLCHGDNTTLTVTASGGTGTLTYSLDGINYQPENTFTVGAGTYTVTVKDESPSPGPCTQTSNTITVTQPTALSISLASKTDVNCYGESTGSITVAGNGGTVPYKYSINGTDYFNTSGTFGGLAAGTYTLYVQDNNNCGPVTTSVTISQPSAALSGTTTLTQPTCYQNGKIELTVTGGTPPYTYDWADLAGSNNPEDRLGIPAGTYSVVVTDDHGCTWSSGNLVLNAPSGCTGVMVCSNDHVSVFSAPPDPDITSWTWTLTRTVGPTDAPQPIFVTGQGTSLITIDWNDTYPGTFELCVTAHNVCGTSAQTCRTIYVNQVVAEAQAGPVCEGDNLYLFASGGGTYAWTGPGGFTSSSANPVIYGATSADDGTYTVTVTGSTGCTATATVDVTVNPRPVVSGTVSNASCGLSTGSITLTVSGGSGSYNYQWSNGATTQDLTNIPSGIYTVTVTDAAYCETEATFTVSDGNGPQVTASGVNIDCAGSVSGSATATISSPGTTPPYTFTWSNGTSASTSNLSHTISGLTAGTYSVLVTDANGCKAAASVILTEPYPLSPDFTKQDIDCYGGNTGSISLLVSGGTTTYSFSWSASSGGNVPSGQEDDQNLTGLIAGTYTVMVTDANLCTATLSVQIIQPVTGLAATATPSPVSCNGGNNGYIDLTVSGGTSPYNYSWSKDGGGFSASTEDISGLTAGTYSVTVTDSKLCTYPVTGIIVSEPAVLLASGTKTDVSCYGGSDGSIDLSVTGGTATYTYTWSNGATTQDVSGLPAGNYSVTVTDYNGCTASASFTINQPSLLTAAAVATAAGCYGASTGSVALTVGGGTGPYTYLWSNSATSEDLTGVPAGYYSVTVTDSKGCIALASATVNEPSQVMLSGVVTNLDCFGDNDGMITVTATGGTSPYQYKLDGGTYGSGNSFTSLSAGTYTIWVKDDEDCETWASFSITSPTAIALSGTTSDISCYGGSDGSINITVSGGVVPYTYLWSNSATTEDITGLAAGTYSVTVTDQHGCQKTLSGLVVSQPAQLTVSVNLVKNVTCKGGSDGSATAVPSDGTPGYTYLWSNGSTAQTPDNFTAGYYTVTVTDSKGCTATGSVTITEPATEMILYATTMPSSSCGGSTGSIDLTVENASGTPTYLWSNGYTGQDPSGLAAGTYSVTVTDGLGCMAILTGITVETAPTLIVTVDAYDRSCLAADGSVYAVVSGGVGPCTYSWTPVSSSSSYLIGLDVGTYYVTVTDANGCTANGSGTVEQPSCAPPVAVDDYFTSCNGLTISSTVATGDTDEDNSLAELEFLPLNGPSAEQGTIAWDPSYNGAFIFTPASGYSGTVTITYRVEDPDGLTDEGLLTIYISQMAAEITAENTSHVNCGATNGSVTVTHAGGYPDYTYLWNDPAAQTTVTATGLAAGTYTVTVTDSENCQVTAEVTIYNVCLTVDKSRYAINGSTGDEKYDAAGDVITYHIVVTNTGNITLTNTVVADPLTGLSQTIASLAPGASETIVTNYTVQASDLIAGSIANTATATYTYNSVTYSDSDGEIVYAGAADVGISKSVSDPTPYVGSNVTFTLQVQNYGPAAAIGVVVNDLLPSGYTYVSDDGAGAYNPSTGVWTIGTMAPSSSVSLNITATVLPTGNYVNTATVTSTSTDLNMANNSDDSTPVPVPVADLSVTKTDSPDPVIAGNTLTYTIVVSNLGPSPAAEVLVIDNLPVSLLDQEFTPSVGSWTTPNWDIGTLAVGSSATMIITAQVDPAFQGTTVSNTVTVQSSTYDPNIANNSATATTTVSHDANLTITKTHTNTYDPVVAGSYVQYAIVVTNTGPGVAYNVLLTDNNTNLTDMEFSYTGNGSWFAWNGTLDVGTLQPGAVTGGYIRGKVKSDFTGTLSNTATVTWNSYGNSTETASATDEVTVNTSADLGVVKILVGPLKKNQLGYYNVVVTNYGPSDAPNVVISDAFNSSFNTPEYYNGTNWVSWTGSLNIGSLSPLGTYTLELRATVDNNATSPVSNTALVDSDVDDPVPGNNSSTTTNDLNVEADLGITKTGPVSVVAGETITYELAVHNYDNNYPAQNVVITDNINTSFISNPQYSLTIDGTYLDWNGSYPVGSLAAGASYTIYIRGTVLPSVTTDVPNTASVSSSTPEPNNSTYPNTASTSTPVTQSADLSIVKSVETLPEDIIAGQNIIFKQHIVNDGPSSAYAVFVSDVPQTGLTFIEYSGDNGVTWLDWPTSTNQITVGAMAPGSVDILIKALIDISHCSPIINIGTVSSDTEDPNPANNTSNTVTSDVLDKTPPALQCPANITVNCDASTDPSSTGNATATDNCDNNPGITYADARTDGSCAYNYTITRTWTATDASGNSSVCSQIITVHDVTEPVITCPESVSVECTNQVPAHATNNATFVSQGGTVTDNCTASADITVEYVSDIISNWVCNNRYTLTRTYKATDECGNAATCQQVITVFDDKPATFDTPPDITLSCEQNYNDLLLTGNVTNVVGNCGGTNQIISHTDEVSLTGCNGTGTVTRTWTVTDQCGNAASDVQVITVVDITPPVITCPADITVTATAGECTSVVTIVNPTATDNCTPAGSITFSGTRSDALALDAPYPVGVTTITWTATDACNNTSTSCAQTITVNAIPPTIAVGDASVTEGSTMNFAITLNHAACYPVTFTPGFSNVTTTNGDYTQSPIIYYIDGTPYTWTGGDITIPAGVTSVLFNVPTTADTYGEPTETFTLTATVTSGNTSNTSDSGTGEILDNDAVSVAINDVTVAEETPGYATFTVTLTGDIQDALSVNYLTANNTAIAGSDYTTTSGTLTFPAGSPSGTTLTITVPILDDNIGEPTEDYYVNLTNLVSTATTASISDAQGVGTITDTYPSLAVNDASVTEGGTLEFTVSLSTPSSTPVTFTPSFANVTTTDGDYTQTPILYTTDGGSTWQTWTSGDITIPVGVTSVLFDVPTIQDIFDEPDETFTLIVTGTSGNTSNTSDTGTGTILDDDTATIAVNDVTVTEGNTLQFNVTLSTPSATDVVFTPSFTNVTTTDGDYTQTPITYTINGVDYTWTGGPITIPAGTISVIFNVPSIDDLLDENTETFTLTVTSPTAGSDTGTGTIEDNDTAVITSITPDTREEGIPLYHTVTLSTTADHAMTYPYSVAGVTATDNVDYNTTPTFSDGVINNGDGTITVPAGVSTFTVTYASIEDPIDESDETYTVSVGGISATGTITDDDTSAIAVNDATVEEGGTLAFTVSLSTPSATDVVFTPSFTNVTTTDGDYTQTPITYTINGVDYTWTGGTITIPAGTTSVLFNVPTTDDAIPEPSETFTLTVTSPTAGSDSGTGTILDNDGAISLDKAGTYVDAWPAPSGDGVQNAGDQITYVFTVTNTGYIPLYNVLVTDANPNVIITGGTIGTLAPGATATATAIYTLTQADIDAGSFTNTATVSSVDADGDPVTDTDDDTRNFTLTPGWSLTKVASENIFCQQGDILHYTLTLDNTGNVSIGSISMTDPGATTGPTYSSGDANSNSILEPTETWIYTATHTIVQNDLDAATFTNTATAHGTPAGGTLTDVTASATVNGVGMPGPITGPTDVCAGTTNTYSIATVTGAASYNWTVPPGSIITGDQGTTSITVTMGTASGQVCVSAVNGTCVHGPSCLPVTVTQVPAKPVFKPE